MNTSSRVQYLDTVLIATCRNRSHAEMVTCMQRWSHTEMVTCRDGHMYAEMVTCRDGPYLMVVPLPEVSSANTLRYFPLPSP